jgi:phosphoserine aminotransferase
MTTHYFSPGPARLPQAVRTRLHEEFLDTFGIGVSIVEISHRTPYYGALNDETLALIRQVFEVPETHTVLMSVVGAQQHFGLLIPHLSLPGDTIAYTRTGLWSEFACEEAFHSGRKVALVYDGKEGGYVSLGDPTKWDVPTNARFVHITVNNTVYGTEFPTIPTFGDIPLVLDMTSALGARRDIPWAQTGLIYASAQKNFGIAGVSAVIIRNDLLEQSRDFVKKNNVPRALSYPAIFDAKSILNTPPVFAIFAMNRMLQWMRDRGSTAAMEAVALEKAKLIYDALDGGVYRVRPEKPYRSRHNFVFSLPTAEQDAHFIAQAAKENILEIAGYKVIGGLRASIYNGVELPSVEVLAHFIKQYREKWLS